MTFRQSDIQHMIQAGRKAGMINPAVKLTPEGPMVLDLGIPAQQTPADGKKGDIQAWRERRAAGGASRPAKAG